MVGDPSKQFIVDNGIKLCTLLLGGVSEASRKLCFDLEMRPEPFDCPMFFHDDRILTPIS